MFILRHLRGLQAGTVANGSRRIQHAWTRPNAGDRDVQAGHANTVACVTSPGAGCGGRRMHDEWIQAFYLITEQRAQIACDVISRHVTRRTNSARHDVRIRTMSTRSRPQFQTIVVAAVLEMHGKPVLKYVPVNSVLHILKVSSTHSDISSQLSPLHVVCTSLT